MCSKVALHQIRPDDGADVRGIEREEQPHGLVLLMQECLTNHSDRIVRLPFQGRGTVRGEFFPQFQIRWHRNDLDLDIFPINRQAPIFTPVITDLGQRDNIIALLPKCLNQDL
jgi:hypothetical protein